MRSALGFDREDPERARQVRDVAVLLAGRCRARQRDDSSRSCLGGCAPRHSILKNSEGEEMSHGDVGWL